MGLQIGEVRILLPRAGSFQFASVLNIQSFSSILCLNLWSINFVSSKRTNTELPIKWEHEGRFGKIKGAEETIQQVAL